MFNDPKRDLFMKQEEERLEKAKEKKKEATVRKLEADIRKKKEELHECDGKIKTSEMHRQGKRMLMEKTEKNIAQIQEHSINQNTSGIRQKELEIERMKKMIEDGQREIHSEQQVVERKKNEIITETKEIEQGNAEKTKLTQELHTLETELHKFNV